MNSRKRQASDSLLPTRSIKHQRTEESQSILSRWRKLGVEVFRLGQETFQILTASGEHVESESEPTSKPKAATTGPSAPSQFNHSHLPSRPPIPIEFQRPMDPPRRSQLSSSQPSRSESSRAMNGSAMSPPSTLTGYTSATSIASTSKAENPNSQFLKLMASSGHSTQDIQRFKFQGQIRHRPHILAKEHKNIVQQTRRRDREELIQELYNLRRKAGYDQGYDTFKNDYINYAGRLEILSRRDVLSPSSSLTDLRAKSNTPTLSHRHSFSDDVSSEFLERAIRRMRQSLSSPPPKPFAPSHDLLRRSARQKDEKIEQSLRPKAPPLPAALPADLDAQVTNLLTKRGIVSKIAREQVSDKDISRLLPCQWLNDEIINFYGQMILSRSEASKENPGVNGVVGGKNKPLNVHYFNTFFWSKMRIEGYERSRLAKWTKKFDIFAKDVILIPINHNNSHWTAAAINFRRKRIESFDSMSLDRQQVFKTLRQYLDLEHRNKKKQPFDFTGWEDYDPEDTPQQENGYDCGVFTCQFLESLSRGEEIFNFTQRDMSYLRRRMIWEIGNAKFLGAP